MSEGQIRSFIALRLPETVRVRLVDEVAPLRRRVPELAWVRVDNLHLTIRFLGSLDPSGLEAAGAAVGVAAREVVTFPVVLGGLGAFPGPRAARVVWAGVVTGGEALVALHGAIERELAARGFAPEPQPFHPHVTLARTRRGTRSPGLGGALGPGPGFGSFRVDRVDLMRSDLGAGGPRYTPLVEVPLKPGPAGDVATGP